MEQNYTNQTPKKKPNITIFVIIGIILAAVILAAVVFTSENGSSLLGSDGLSGRYELTNNGQTSYLDFKSGGKVVHTKFGGDIIDATYTLNDNRVEIRATSLAGLEVLYGKGTVSDNKREIVFNSSGLGLDSVTFVKK